MRCGHLLPNGRQAAGLCKGRVTVSVDHGVLYDESLTEAPRGGLWSPVLGFSMFSAMGMEIFNNVPA